MISNIKQLLHSHRFLLLVALSFMFSTVTIVASNTSASAASLTTWQKFVKEKCGGRSADAAEKCATDLTKDLKKACGPEKKTEKYKTCWRKFIKDNGGTAGPSSSPFEEEVALTIDGPGTIEECADIETSIIKCDNTGGNPIMSLILQIVNFLAVGVGIAVIGGIIWGGMLYASSNGDSGQTKKGITAIVNAVIGLLLFIFMYAIMNFLIPGGLFT